MKLISGHVYRRLEKPSRRRFRARVIHPLFEVARVKLPPGWSSHYLHAVEIIRTDDNCNSGNGITCNIMSPLYH